MNTLVCRVCLQITEDPDSYNLNNSYPNAQCTILRDKCRKCLPETNFSITNDGILCSGCYYIINSFYDLRNKSIKTEETISNFMRANNFVDLKLLALPNLYNYNKRNVDIKIEAEVVSNEVLPDDEPQICTEVEPITTNSRLMLNNVQQLEHTSLYRSNSSGPTDVTEQVTSIPEVATNGVINEILCPPITLKLQKRSKRLSLSLKRSCSFQSTSSADFADSKYIIRSENNIGVKDYASNKELSLAVHMFKCCYCNFESYIKKKLAIHMSVHVTISKPYKLRNRHPVNKYSNVGLLNIEPFQCLLCNFSSSLKSQVKRHVKTHSNKKPFMCNLCKKRFVLKGMFKRHLDFHCKGNLESIIKK